MKKMCIMVGLIAAVALSATAQTTYYWQGPQGYPDDGIRWNTAQDGTGTPGTWSDTYRDPAHDLVIGDKDVYGAVRMSENTYYDWNGNSYTMQANSAFRMEKATDAGFNNGDIIAAGDFFIYNASGGSPGNVTGTANIQLGSNVLTIREGFSSANGHMDIGLNVVGDGEIFTAWSPANMSWGLTALSSDFTGTINGSKMDGILQLVGAGASSASLLLADGDSRLGRLDLNNAITVGSLDIQGLSIPAGTYTAAQLDAYGIANGQTIGDNFIDNGGTITVIPEPATMGLFALAGTALFFARRAKVA